MKVYVEAKNTSVLPLLQESVSGELHRLQLSLKRALSYLQKFEEKYQTTSEIFFKQGAAEDLEGADEEYVEWYGEYQLMLRIKEKLAQIESLEYDTLSVSA